MAARQIPIAEAFRQGVALHFAGQWEQAELVYQAILQASPDHPGARHNLDLLVAQREQAATAKPGIPAQEKAKLASLATEQPAAAQALARQLVEDYPDDPFGWKSLGISLAQSGDCAAALPCLEKALSVAPGDPETCCGLGDALQELGRPEEALPFYHQAIAGRPGYAEAHNNLGAALQTLGRPREAAEQYLYALQEKPDYAEANSNLGNVLKGLGRLEQALTYFSRALASNPELAAVHNNMGNTLQGLGRYDEAIAHYAQALRLAPEYTEAHSNLGTACKVLGRLDEAIIHFSRALMLDSNFAAAHNNLGAVLQERGCLDNAATHFSKALELEPDCAEAHNNLGNALQGLDRLKEAVAHYTKALTLAPEYAEAHNNLGNALQKMGRLEAAVARHKRALELKPDLAEAWNNLGNALQRLGRVEEAEQAYRQALERNPTYAEACNNLGTLYKESCRLDEAETCFREALHDKPDFAEAHTNLGNVFQKLGQLDAAVACHKQALACNPGYSAAQSNLLFALGHHSSVSPEAYLAEARQWDKTAVSTVERQAAHVAVFHRQPRPGRRLKIGYVSGDFRRHAVSAFIEDILRGHDRTRFEVFAYATNLTTDATTQRLLQYADCWTQLAGLTDAAATERIRSDNIDVLIDLSGHTKHNRLTVFAKRAAPVQAHYLGYFASTGLAEMDYFISDATVIPESEDAAYSETVWRLPRLWLSYHGDDNAPLPAWQPAADGKIWFGGFNNLNKLTPESIALWSKILRACPRGNLLLKTAEFVSPAIREQYRNAFAAQGIAPDRLSLLGSVPDWSTHMALYDRLDVALDPVGGHCGVTTTCDALWMGLPVVTMIGRGMVRRMCAAILTGLGRSEWITADEDAYVALALQLGESVSARRMCRLGQREQMRRSAVCDGPGLVGALEAAYEGMYARRSPALA